MNFSTFLRRFGSLIGLLLLCAALSVLSPYFLTVNNLLNILRQSSINALLALGVLLPILTGGIDLSVGSIMALSICIMAKMAVHWGINPLIVLIATLMIGTTLGVINGLMLTKLRLPHPFISTLGMMNIARGLALIVTAGFPISGLPPLLRFFGAANIGRIPVPALVVFIVYAIYYIILNHTAFGRYLYAVGGNKEAARLSGVNVDRVLVLAYANAGFLSALAGVVLAGRVNSGYPLAGLGSELDAIAGAVIGGASLFGGEGGVGGTIVGVLIMGVLRNGLNLLNVSAYWQTVVIGVVVVLAVWVDVLRREAEYKASVKETAKETNGGGDK